MALDLSTDHLVFDGLEPIILDGHPIPDAWRSDLIETEGAPSEGVYLHTDVEWQIPTPPGIVPRVGHVIVDGEGRTYNILSVRQPFMDDYYGCTCRQVKIEEDLSSLVTLFPAIVSVHGDGTRIVDNSTAAPLFSDIPARIQVMPCTIAEYMGKRGFERLYHIYVARDIELHRGDVLKDETLTIYDVLSWQNRKRIDELSIIICHVMN